MGTIAKMRVNILRGGVIEVGLRYCRETALRRPSAEMGGSLMVSHHFPIKRTTSLLVRAVLEGHLKFYIGRARAVSRS